MNEARQQIKTPEKTTISCEVAVRFGRMSMDCRNFGFCRIELAQERKAPEGKNMVLATMSYLDRCLYFQFSVEQFPEGVNDKYFGKERFWVEEEYALSKACCNSLGISDFVIAKGCYNIIEKEGKIWLTILG